MHDARIEEMLRRTLQAEAGSMTMTITVGVLERRLTERRLRARTTRRLVAAASLAAVALAGGAVVFSLLQSNLPPVATTPSPSPSAPASAGPTATLPPTTELLSEFPAAIMLLERSEGPATGPTDPPSSGAPGASPTPVEAGRVRFNGPFVIGLACVGEGEMVVQVASPNLFGDLPYTTAFGPCDGTPVVHEYRAEPIDPSSPGDIISVSVSDGTSWRLAVGELPVSSIQPPSFSPIATTPDWNLVMRPNPVMLSANDAQGPRTGGFVAMPDEATRMGVFVQCQGEGSVTVAVAEATPVEVACDAVGTTRRVEFAAVGGEGVQIAAVGDRSGLWVNLAVEVDAELATTYPVAPSLPPGLADVPYAAPDGQVLAFGTLGSNRQTILPVVGTTPGQPAGDWLPVARTNELTGARLDLVSITTGNMVRNLATYTAPAFIFESWADATHERVYYALANPTEVQFRRVNFDGVDDVVVATVPREGRTGFTAELAQDDSVFVVDFCLTGPICTRVVVDGASGEVTATERSGDPLCRILGLAEGRIVATSRIDCSGDGTTSLLDVPVDSTAGRVILPDAVPDVSGGVVVVLPEGLTVAYGAFEGSTSTTKLINVDDGSITDLPPSSVGDQTLPPASIRLPPGWLLLSAGLGDFPWQKAFDRPAPVLVDLVTGERIELVNLPHWKGMYEF